MWQGDFGSWLIHSAVFGVIILAIGAIAVRLCRQPVYRIRIIQLTLVACLLVPLLQQVKSLPHVSLNSASAQSLNTVSRGLESAKFRELHPEEAVHAVIVTEASVDSKLGSSSVSSDRQRILNCSGGVGEVLSLQPFNVSAFILQILKSVYLIVVASARP